RAGSLPGVSGRCNTHPRREQDLSLPGTAGVGPPIPVESRISPSLGLREWDHPAAPRAGLLPAVSGSWTTRPRREQDLSLESAGGGALEEGEQRAQAGAGAALGGVAARLALV